MSDQPIVILGSSGAGVSLALAAARAGGAVTLIETDPHARERAQVFARKDDPAATARVLFTGSLDPLAGAGFVFDALEDGAAAFDARIPPKAVRATPRPEAACTGLAHPRQWVRMLPFQPMQLRALTEVTGFALTSDQVVSSAVDLALRTGRVPVVLRQGQASIGLRLLDRVQQVADQLLLEGAILWELDEAMVEFGFDLGLYEAQDLTGLDVAYARRQAQGRPSLIADRAVQEGRIGKKIGWGWYRYPGGGGAVIDPLIEDLIREEAWFAKVSQRSFSADEILQTLVHALVDETGSILRDGLLADPSDLDRIAVHGLGFPAEQGGLIAASVRLGGQRGSSGG